MKKTRKRICLFLILMLATTCFPTEVAAYKYTGWKIPPNYVIAFVPDSQFGAQTISDMNEALYEWNRDAGRTLMRREPTKRHSTSNYPQQDGESRIYRLYKGTNVALAEMTPMDLMSSYIFEADILLNISWPYVNGAYSGKYDTWGVFLHEAGHAAGMDHSTTVACCMYNTSRTNSTTYSYLKYDDTTGIRNLYKGG